MKYLFCFIILLFKINSFSQEQFVVYFNSDKFELTKTENQKLNDWMNLHTKDKIVAINGYTDEDGSSGYNDTLAKKRVNHVFEIIKSVVPFREDFKSRSYGENFDQSKNKAENRKVTIYYIEEINLAYENEILGIEISHPENIEFIEEIVYIDDSIKTKKSLEEQIIDAKIGSTIKIENMNFYLNQNKIIEDSFKVLKELLNVMQNHPKLVIEVQGHVCCNPNEKDKISIKLSHSRAKVIKNYLVDNGINKNRISYKGYGSSQPVYKIPEKTYIEAIANRRVEILILEN